MTDPNTHFEILPNGLTLLLREVRLAPVAELQIWANVGSADEGPGEEGLAHFHEHMLFKGTDKRGVGEVANEIEGAGGRINAYTSFDTTVYHVTVPSAAVETGVDVLADALRHSSFDPDEISREIEVVIEEIRRSLDSPLHVLSDAVFAEAFHVHPYRAPILGTPETVSKFDRERVRDFFGRWYAADNLVFSAVGDFDARAVREAVWRAFEGAEPARPTRSRPAEPPQRQLREVILRKPFERVRLDLTWPASRFDHPDAIRLDLLSYVLGESESSRLVRRVKEREDLVDRIDSGAYTPLDPGLFSVTIDVDSRRARDAIAATVREVERLRSEPVSADELERARVNFLASEHFERESVSGQARKLTSFQVFAGDWRGEKRILDRIRETTAEDLQRVAQQYLAMERLTVGALLPESETNGLDRESIHAAVAKGVETTRHALSPPAKLHRDETLRSYTLTCGATLHVLPRLDVPVVAVRAACLGGLLADSAEHAGLTSFLAANWLRGTGARSAADFARSVEDLASDIDSFSGRSSIGLTLDVTREKFEPSLDLFAEVLLDPAFADPEIERERRDTLAAIERREDQLAQLAYQQFTETHYGRHPYRLPMLGTRQSVERFDRQLLQAQHARLVQAENLTIAVSGDVDPDATAEALSSRLAALPCGSFQALAREIEDPPQEIRRAELLKDRAQAHLVLGFRGVTVRDPDRFALELLAQILAGQGGRLFLELRDKRSLAYSVNAVNVEGVDPGFFSLYIATAPDKLAEAQTGMLEELERLRSEEPTDAELDRAKRHLVGTFAIDQQRNSSRAGLLALDALYGIRVTDPQRYTSGIEGVTREDLRRVCDAVLRLDAYTLSIVRPS